MYRIVAVFHHFARLTQTLVVIAIFLFDKLWESGFNDALDFMNLNSCSRRDPDPC